ncbi:hypothetical protein [Micromonospora aurantiaca (nom. illeg.)]|uniref:hypothetical protein n=1 Tax=Micromonospora aurantiaca (nom. illeg.) TaxID=47850 RepID=UPI003F4A3115
MTGSRAVAVAPEDRQAEALATCTLHAIAQELTLVAVAPTIAAALELLLNGEVDVVILPDDAVVPVQVAGQPFRRGGALPAAQRSPDVVPASAVPPGRRRPRRMDGRRARA